MRTEQEIRERIIDGDIRRYGPDTACEAELSHWDAALRWVLNEDEEDQPT